MRRIQAGSLETSYSEVGTGPPIVWISGGGGRASDWTLDYAQPLADRYRSITFELRGTAGTNCSQKEPWTVKDFAADASSLIVQLCDRPAVVVGHSLGALIMLQLAVDRPDLVELGISLAGAVRGDQGWLGDYMRAEVELREAGGSLAPSFSAIHYAALMYPASALGDPDTWRRIKQGFQEGDAAENIESTVLSQWIPCISFDVSDRISRSTVPLEVVAFSEDVCAPPQYSAELVRLSGHGRYHELTGLGHGSLFGHRPREVSDLVRSLIDEHFSRGGKAGLT